MDKKTLAAAVLCVVFFLGMLAGRAAFPAAAAGPTVDDKTTNVIYTNSPDGSKLYMWDLRGKPEVTIYYDTGTAVKSKFTINEISRRPR